VVGALQFLLGSIVGVQTEGSEVVESVGVAGFVDEIVAIQMKFVGFVGFVDFVDFVDFVGFVVGVDFVDGSDVMSLVTPMRRPGSEGCCMSYVR
jgi:hypothetical protein